MRSPVLPSHSGGTLPDFQRPSNRRPSAGASLAGSVPISSLVPSVTVSGRSVVLRIVMHGTPITVVSSVTPPESVMTAFACLTR